MRSMYFVTLLILVLATCVLVCMTLDVSLNTIPTMDPEEIDDEELEEIRSVYPIARDIVLKPRISVAMKISRL